MSAQEFAQDRRQPSLPRIAQNLPGSVAQKSWFGVQKRRPLPKKNGMVLGKVLQRLLLMENDFGRHFGHGFGHLLGGVLGTVLSIGLGKAAHKK